MIREPWLEFKRLLFIFPRMTWTIPIVGWFSCALHRTGPSPCSSSWCRRNKATSSRSPWKLTRIRWLSWSSSISTLFPSLPTCASSKRASFSWQLNLETSKTANFFKSWKLKLKWCFLSSVFHLSNKLWLYSLTLIIRFTFSFRNFYSIKCI